MKEIKGWLDRRIYDFMVQENRNPRLSKEEWLNCNLYMGIHEIFFASFSTELWEWIAKLEDSQGRWKFDDPIVWTLELVQTLEASKDKITNNVDHWIDQIIRGFITEFVIGTLVSYSEAEQGFLKGPWGKYIKYLSTLIKMLLCKKRVMQLPWCSGLCKVEKLTITKKIRDHKIAPWFHLHEGTRKSSWRSLCKVWSIW